MRCPLCHEVIHSICRTDIDHQGSGWGTLDGGRRQKLVRVRGALYACTLCREEFVFDADAPRGGKLHRSDRTPLVRPAPEVGSFREYLYAHVLGDG